MSDEVARLVRLAGTNGAIAAERIARVRTAVYGAWSDEYVVRQEKTRRRRLTVSVLFAAAASVVIAAAIWPAPVVARIDRVTKQAMGSRGPVADGSAVKAGSTVTTSAGTAAMTLASGVHLSQDAASTIRLDSATDVVLERGAVYVNSGGVPGASPISIHTPAGDVVRAIGTRFDVRLTGGGMRVRVFDGEVLVTYANGAAARARAGE